MSLPEWYRGMPVETYDVQRQFWPFKCEPGDYYYLPDGYSCQELSIVLKTLGDCHFAYEVLDDAFLPALPGLTIMGETSIPTPLTEKHARKLTDRCVRSTLGVNRWTLPAKHVSMKHPDWDKRIKELGALISGKMKVNTDKHYVLDVILEELEVIGPGGYLNRTKDPDSEESGVLAKLVVQLPSLHVGGDLMVYDGEVAYRFDFGENKGTAAFRPSYAVYVAGAEYQVEEVKRGFRVALVYSVRLPTGEQPAGMKISRRKFQRELQSAVDLVGGGNETFALLLSNDYGDYHDFEHGGCDLLKDDDHGIFNALQKANALVPAKNQLEFYLVKLQHTTELARSIGQNEGSGRDEDVKIKHWHLKKQFESIVWLNTSGRLLHDSEKSGTNCEWTDKLNFLNPDDTWPRTMWNKHMHREGEFDEQTIEYNTYAIVGWSATQDCKHGMFFMGAYAVLKEVLTDDPVSAAKLRKFTEAATGASREINDDDCGAELSRYAIFCQSLCTAVERAGDPDLLQSLPKFINRLRKKEQLTESFETLMRRFGWSNIRKPFVEAVEHTGPHHGMSLALSLTGVFDSNVDAKTATTMLAVKKAQEILTEDLSSSPHIRLLWKCAMACREKAAFLSVERLFKQMDPSLLGPTAEIASQIIADAYTEEQRLAFALLISIRLQWVEAEIPRLANSLTWKIPDACFPDNTDIEAFLQGPEPTFVVRGFTDINDARAFIDKHDHQSVLQFATAGFLMAAHGTEDDAIVVITKTRMQCESPDMLKALQAELKRLSNIPLASLAHFG